jgi:hypothetical protein
MLISRNKEKKTLLDALQADEAQFRAANCIFLFLNVYEDERWTDMIVCMKNIGLR